MPDILLYDRDGNALTFPSVNKVNFKLSDGTPQVFKLLDLDEEVEGYSVPVVASGSSNFSTSGALTCAHTLGMMPDVLVVWFDTLSAGYIQRCSSMSGALMDAMGDDASGSWEYVYSGGTAYKLGTLIGHDREQEMQLGQIQAVTPTSFTIGCADFPAPSGTLRWYAIGNLVKHEDYLYITLGLDNAGNLLVYGGSSAIEQLKIYIDGVLSKTVDYIHADEVTVDLADVVSDMESHAVTVEALGDNLEDRYAHIWYEPVTGIVVPTVSGTCGNAAIWTYNIIDGTLTISGEGAMTDYTAASEQPWYQYAAGIKTVVVENDVSYIGTYAFNSLASLTEVKMATSVLTAQTDAFGDCTGLNKVFYGGTLEQWCGITFANTRANPCINGAKLYFNDVLVSDVEIPESVETLKNYVFSGCTSIVSVVIPDHVTSIGSNAFRYNTALTTLSLGSGIDAIPLSMCYGCSSLAAIDIPEGVLSIGNFAFDLCSNLASVTLPECLTSIGTQAFHSCTSLTAIVIPESVTSMGDYLFSLCSNLKSVNIPNGVTSIGKSMFHTCSALTAITIPAGVTSIGEHAFRGSGLTSIIIPAAVTRIDAYAFYSCSALIKAVFDDSTTWKVYKSATATSGTTISSVSFSSTSTAATYLRSTYAAYYWYKT